MREERRRTPRIRILGELQGRETGTDGAVLVREISLGGMALETTFPFPPDVVLEFQLELGDGSVLDLRARATHSHVVDSSGASPGQVHVTGFAFVDGDSDGAGEVGQLIDRVR
jgi:hypothetical protein